MIVMKFGGSSLASAASFRRVISIIRSQLSQHPVVVASAMGDTTDSLLAILAAARRADSYSAWNLQETLKDQHFAVCEELLQGDQRRVMDRYLRDTFRDLHLRMLELCEGERTFTAELQDWTVSLGEQLSSRMLAAVLQEHCGNSLHLDSRKLIVTDNAFTNAQPLYYETYARIRWSVPIAARDNLVVLGGFMGSTEDGRTTTLGRGGSDLTASIVGAAINADEIQVWKDVDGMLTCDPRVLPGGHKVKRLSYEEASELANAGATILHPETMAPAKRLRIPIVIRNTFSAGGEGTRIESGTASYANLVKSIAIKEHLTLLEISSADQTNNLEALIAFCKKRSSGATVLCSSERVVYVAVAENCKIQEESLAPSACLEVRVRSRQAILTLVGQIQDKEAITKKIIAALQGTAAFIILDDESRYSVRLAVPQDRLKQCIHLLHDSFFSNPNLKFFVADKPSEKDHSPVANDPSQAKWVGTRSFVLSKNMLQPN